MSATALAAISTLEVILFGKHYKPFRSEVIIFFIKLIGKHYDE